MVTETRTTLSGDAYTEPSADASLTTRVSVSENQDLGERAYRLTIEVTAAQNISQYIFVYEQVPATPGRTRNQYRFVTVATPVHLAELPIDVASPESGYMCRKNSATLYYPSASAAETARDDILRRINNLCEDTEALARMSDTLDVTWAFTTDDTSSAPGGGSSV